MLKKLNCSLINFKLNTKNPILSKSNENNIILLKCEITCFSTY